MKPNADITSGPTCAIHPRERQQNQAVSRPFSNSLRSWAPLLFSIASVAVISGTQGQMLQAVASAAMVLVLCSSTLPVVRFLAGPGAASIILAFPCGYLLHSLGLSLAAWAFGFNPVTLSAYAAASLLGAVWLWRRAKEPPEPVIPWGHSESWILLIWLVAVTTLVAPAFLHVGAETPAGFAYRAYFNTDVFRNMATSGSLLRTGIPPDNPYFHGITLNYYWLFHVIPAFWMTVLPGYRVEFLFVQFAFATALAFAALLWACARRLARKAATTAWLLPLFLLGGSYEGLYVLNHLHEKGMKWQEFTTLNVDGILRWVEKLPQVDTLFRPLLYAPQHLMAVIVFFMVFLVWPGENRTGRRILLLALAFISVGFSVIVGAITVLVEGTLMICDAARRRKGIWVEILCGSVLGAGFLALYFKSYSMFSIEGHALQFVLHQELIAKLHSFIFFQWGAILLFGAAGLLFWKQKDMRYLVLLLFSFLSAVFIVFVRIDVPGLSDVSLKAGYISHASLLLFSASFIDRVLAAPARRILLAFAMTAAILPASTTLAMDLYNSQDIGNAKFTTYVAKSQMELYTWIRKNLQANARMQDFVSAGPNFIESYVSETPPFANRSLYLGDTTLSQIFQTPKPELNARRATNVSLVEAEDPRRISYLAQKAGIEFLIVSPQDDSPFDLRSAHKYFDLVMQKESWILFHVLPHKTPIYYDRGDYLDHNDSLTHPTLVSRYESGFHPVEALPDGEPARWMSQNGVILVQAEREFHGSLIFLAQSYGKARTLQVRWNGSKILSAVVTQNTVKIRVPITIPSGESSMLLHSMEDPVSGPGADRRLLSVKVWELQFRSRE